MSESRNKQRFPLRLPVQIESGKGEHKATTRDLSAAGVFIEAQPNLRIGSRLSFRLALPAELLGTPRGVTVQCEGHVVRVDKHTGKSVAGHRHLGVACVIDSYKFVRKN